MIKKERLAKIKQSLKKYSFFKFLGRGRRGFVYKISESLIVKIERDDIQTFNTIKKEYTILKRIGRFKYFPKPINYNDELRFLIREFVPGNTIEKTGFNKEILKECMLMCYTLDKLGINQSELTNPVKHIYVDKGSVMMIDFERARLTKTPKNVTQFTQYVIKKLKIRNDKLVDLVKEYKKSYNKRKFNELLLLLKLNLVH